MRILKIVALSATLVVATAGLALAGGDCGSKAKAETASAHVCTGACEATCAASAATASAVKTAGTGCATSEVKTAGAGCATSATKTADASSCAGKEADMAVELETVRMPSGAMAVFYHGKNAATVSYLQASAKGGCQGFACDLAKNISKDEHCSVEMAQTKTGVMMLVSADDSKVLDNYEAQYAAAMAPAETQSE